MGMIPGGAVLCRLEAISFRVTGRESAFGDAVNLLTESQLDIHSIVAQVYSRHLQCLSSAGASRASGRKCHCVASCCGW